MTNNSVDRRGGRPEDPPLRLFKFRPINKFTSDIFCRGVLWFSRPDSFNDPCDCLPVFDWEASEADLRLHLLEAWGEENPTWTEGRLRAAVERAIAQEFPLRAERKSQVEREYQGRIARCGIFSTSERFDSIVMWSHYADQHRGICLELDTTALPANARFHKVQYRNERPRVNLIRDRRIANRVAAGTKSAEWQYEQEWRLALENGPVQFPTEITLPAKMVRGVILGVRIEPGDRDRVLDWCRSLPETPTIYQAQLDPSFFRVNRVVITSH